MKLDFVCLEEVSFAQITIGSYLHARLGTAGSGGVRT